MVTSQNYYLTHSNELLHKFDQVIQQVRPILVNRYGTEKAGELAIAARQEFAAILPRIPDIGGKANHFYFNLIGSAWFLAFYRVLKVRGYSTDEVAGVCTELYRAYLERYPRWVLRLMGWFITSRPYRWWVKRRAVKSQQRRYPADWVYTFVPGEAGIFDYGVDFSACAICKFYHDEDAAALLSHLCMLDFIQTEMLGVRLWRDKTLAQGDDVCNFRFKHI